MDKINTMENNAGKIEVSNDDLYGNYFIEFIGFQKWLSRAKDESVLNVSEEDLKCIFYNKYLSDYKKTKGVDYLNLLSSTALLGTWSIMNMAGKPEEWYLYGNVVLPSSINSVEIDFNSTKSIYSKKGMDYWGRLVTAGIITLANCGINIISVYRRRENIYSLQEKYNKLNCDEKLSRLSVASKKTLYEIFEERNKRLGKNKIYTDNLHSERSSLEGINTTVNNNLENNSSSLTATIVEAGLALYCYIFTPLGKTYANLNFTIGLQEESTKLSRFEIVNPS